jgi:hypothetical protein
MSADFMLLPMPRLLTLTGGTFTFPEYTVIQTASVTLFAAQWLQQRLAHQPFTTQLAAAGGTPSIVLALTSPDIAGSYSARQREQAYRLSIQPTGIRIEASHAAGIFYGVCTLAQMIQQTGRNVPCLTIEDVPDFAERGIMLDVSRDKVPTMATVYRLIELLAGFKINQVQLYMEHTFAYSQHRQVWEFASPFTPQEILELDGFCQQRQIDLVPNQNSLGHMERWLKFPRYNDLSETPRGFQAPWGEFRSPSTLNPLDSRSLDLIRALYDELLPHFSSRYFNIGADEPWELGQGASKAEIEKRGGRVYLEWIQQIYRLVTERGRTMQFWGDIILHYPDLIGELPAASITMEWGYESTHDFAGHGALFAQAGKPFYVCPGTSSWNSLVGRTENAIGNLKSAAENGLKHGAVGYLITDWGDNGHWQPLPVSYLGFAYGAAVAWHFANNQAADMPALLSRLVFADKANVMGKFVYELGNVYQALGPDHINGQTAAYALQNTQADMRRLLPLMDAESLKNANLAPDNMRNLLARVDDLLAGVTQQQMAVGDAALLVNEFTHAARLLQHGAKWLLLASGETDNTPAALETELTRLIVQQQVNWLARNRVGGLSDSIARFGTLLGEYRRMKAAD